MMDRGLLCIESFFRQHQGWDIGSDVLHRPHVLGFQRLIVDGSHEELTADTFHICRPFIACRQLTGIGDGIHHPIAAQVPSHEQGAQDIAPFALVQLIRVGQQFDFLHRIGASI